MLFSTRVLLPDAVLLFANLLYSTSYVAALAVLQTVPPAFLALVRLGVGALILVASCRGKVGLGPREVVRPGDRWRIAGMGVVGFAAAFAFSHWGIMLSTAVNAALLIVVEPVAVMVLSPALLGERLTPRETAGAAAALLGAVLVVVNGIPGMGATLLPHGAGDALLVLAGLAYGAYSLLGRDVLRRHDPLRVTTQSILWGTAAMAPLAAFEARARSSIDWSVAVLLGVAYLSVVITAFGYFVWNWALARIPAPRAAIFLTVQPIVGALLGILLLGEAVTAFTLIGGSLIVLGLLLTVSRPAAR